MGYIPSRRRTGQRSQLWTSEVCVTVIKYFGKSFLSKRHHHPLNRSYCSQNHLTDPPKKMTTDPFHAETPQNLPRTLSLALKDLQKSANLQFATSCLDCPHSYHIRRPTIYQNWFPPLCCPRRPSRNLFHIKNLFPCYNPSMCPTIEALEVYAPTILLIAPVQRTIYYVLLSMKSSALRRSSMVF